MGGQNPYIEETKFTLPTKKYKITFVKEGKTVEVDPEKFPYGHDGLPGSILDISAGFQMGLDHACGGVCACSTCHVIVHQGLESCNEATDAELDQLDEARASRRSRVLAASACPMARWISWLKFPNGTKTTRRKLSTKIAAN